MVGIGPALAVIFIVACLIMAIAACATMVRGGTPVPRRKATKQPEAAASSISADEVIDVHLALQEVTSLRDLR